MGSARSTPPRRCGPRRDDHFQHFYSTSYSASGKHHATTTNLATTRALPIPRHQRHADLLHHLRQDNSARQEPGWLVDLRALRHLQRQLTTDGRGRYNVAAAHRFRRPRRRVSRHATTMTVDNSQRLLCMAILPSGRPSGGPMLRQGRLCARWRDDQVRRRHVERNRRERRHAAAGLLADAEERRDPRAQERRPNPACLRSLRHAIHRGGEPRRWPVPAAPSSNPLLSMPGPPVDGSFAPTGATPDRRT